MNHIPNDEEDSQPENGCIKHYNEGCSNSALNARRIRNAARRAAYFASSSRASTVTMPVVTQYTQDPDDPNFLNDPVPEILLPSFPKASSKTVSNQDSSSSSSSSSSNFFTSFIHRNISKTVKHVSVKRSKSSLLKTKPRLAKATKTAPWIGKIPDDIKVTGVLKRKVEKKKNSYSTIKVGSLVHKKLNIMASDSCRQSKTRLQKAIVFGTVKEKMKRGKWLIKFDNDNHMILKPNEFFLVSEDVTQTMICKNDKNELVVKTAKENCVDLTVSASSTPKKKEIIDLSSLGGVEDFCSKSHPTMKVKIVTPESDNNKTVTEIELFEDSDDEANENKHAKSPYSK
jgi:hypothetical protein